MAFRPSILHFPPSTVGSLVQRTSQATDENLQSKNFPHILFVQVLHLWMCKTRRVSIFRNGIANVVGVLVCVTDLLLVNLFVYTPGVQYIMGTRTPPNFV
jgi:hypothetical protein